MTDANNSSNQFSHSVRVWVDGWCVHTLRVYVVTRVFNADAGMSNGKCYTTERLCTLA